MADVTGPIRTLPGSRHTLRTGAVCDDHPDRPAVKRIQGETDSFGSEMLDLCQECVDSIEKHTRNKEQEENHCEWCKTMSLDVKPTRDPDEGYGGPVYDVCRSCRSKMNRDAQEELDNESDRY